MRRTQIRRSHRCTALGIVLTLGLGACGDDGETGSLTESSQTLRKHGKDFWPSGRCACGRAARLLTPATMMHSQVDGLVR